MSKYLQMWLLSAYFHFLLGQKVRLYIKLYTFFSLQSEVVCIDYCVTGTGRLYWLYWQSYDDHSILGFWGSQSGGNLSSPQLDSLHCLWSLVALEFMNTSSFHWVCIPMSLFCRLQHNFFLSTYPHVVTRSTTYNYRIWTCRESQLCEMRGTEAFGEACRHIIFPS